MAKRPGPPTVSYVERTRGILEGIVPSRSEKGRDNIPAIMLQATITCTCDSFLYSPQRKPCEHVQAMLATLEAEELRTMILDAHVIPPE